MKFIFKTVIVVILFLISLIVFLPKNELYNLVEIELSKKNIIVSNEIREEEPFGFKLSELEIYFDGINTAIIKDININTFLFYTTMNIDEVNVSKELIEIIPSKINSIKVEHSILDFNKALINSNGEFGEFEGKVLLLERKIIGELKPSNIMKMKYNKFLNKFKLVEGKYLYEYKF